MACLLPVLVRYFVALYKLRYKLHYIMIFYHLVNLLQQPSRIQSKCELLFYDLNNLCSGLIFPTYIRCTHDACKYNTWDKPSRFTDVYLIPCQIICTEGVFITEIYVLNNTRFPAPFSFRTLQVHTVTVTW